MLNNPAAGLRAQTIAVREVRLNIATNVRLTY